MAFDASPSWSGFNYQGKVALYYALKLINKESTGADLSKYSLMLEDTEDFEILNNGCSVSIHQVKAYNVSSYSKYSNALIEMCLELSKQPKVSGKVHTWKKINPKTDFLSLEDSIKDDLNSLLTEYTNRVVGIGASIIEKAVSTATNKPKLAAILTSAFPTFTAQELFYIINSIHVGLDDSLSRLSTFTYDDGNDFCDLNAINVKIKYEIGIALDLWKMPNTSEHINKKFYYLLGVMDAYIIQRHKAKQEQDKISITFNELLDALKTDHEDIGLEYLACEFKNKFSETIDDYIGDPEDYVEPEQDIICNLKQVKKYLLSLNPKDLWSFFRNFCPDKYLAQESNTGNAFATDFHGIRYVLIKIFHNINFNRAICSSKNYRLIYQTTDLPYKNYLPTTISDVAKITQIEKAIINNPSMTEILFEIENLIYSGNTSYTFSPPSMTHTQAPQSEDEDHRSKRDEALRNITLVPIATAEEALR